ncbi:MAG: phospholipid/cholesterol/gamma-HCH transport system substrate-binding protein [Campylobacterota bacterium]|nr:phospholipid/cholesterol/gamma-HCH transport system substrate-binding protein [Campylobacterota bacterium]
MESKVNYTLVGAFVLLISSALIAFAFWLGKYNDGANAYVRYKVYLTESVAGLAPEAAVKFNGVDVGKVESIRINPQNSEEIELTLKIKKKTPIRTDSTAMLKFFGITGLAFIEIKGGSRMTPLITNSDDAIAVIPTAPSLIKRLDETLSAVVTKLSDTLDHTNAVMSKQNTKNFSQTLENLKILTHRINGYQNEIDTLLKNSIQTEANIDQAMIKVSASADSVKGSMDTFKVTMSDKLSPTMKSWEETSKKSNALIEKIETSMNRGDYDLQSIASGSTAELNELLAQSRVLQNEMELTLKSLRESPSDILFKQSKPNLGPGE